MCLDFQQPNAPRRSLKPLTSGNHDNRSNNHHLLYRLACPVSRHNRPVARIYHQRTQTMKRSERFRRQSMNKACHATMSFLASIAFAVLAAGAFLSNSPFGSVALLGCALAALAGACWFCYDALFTLELASKERKWEDRRAIRPRI